MCFLLYKKGTVLVPLVSGHYGSVLTQTLEPKFMTLASAIVWPLAGHLIFLSLSFLISKRGILLPTLWEPYNQVFSGGYYRWVVAKLKRVVNENTLFTCKGFSPLTVFSIL